MTPQETSELQPGRDGVIRCSAWLADCERHLDEAEARWNGVTLREECASLQEIDAAWDALEIARREYETALSANADLSDRQHE